VGAKSIVVDTPTVNYITGNIERKEPVEPLPFPGHPKLGTSGLKVLVPILVKIGMQEVDLSVTEIHGAVQCHNSVDEGAFWCYRI